MDAGLVYKITKVTKPELPLKFYEDLSAFKLYLCDCGLMGAMADTAARMCYLAITYSRSTKERSQNSMSFSSCLHRVLPTSIITVLILLVWNGFPRSA